MTYHLRRLCTKISSSLQIHRNPGDRAAAGREDGDGRARLRAAEDRPLRGVLASQDAGLSGRASGGDVGELASQLTFFYGSHPSFC